MMQRHTTIAVLMLAAALAGGCATTEGPSSQSPYLSGTPVTRSPVRAEELTQEAMAHVEDDPARAASLLREALAADLYHGPAHNNLGILHLRSGRLYEAANEFEWARRLMPGHPDPRLNLGIVLERAGLIDDALEAYAAALEVYPDHIESTQALVRARLKYDRPHDATPRMLEQVALRGSNPVWRAWARTRLAAEPSGVARSSAQSSVSLSSRAATN